MANLRLTQGRGEVEPERGPVVGERPRLDAGPDQRLPALEVRSYGDIGIDGGAGHLPGFAELLREDILRLASRVARHPAARPRAVAIVHDVLAASLANARHGRRLHRVGLLRLAPDPWFADRRSCLTFAVSLIVFRPLASRAAVM